MNRLVLYVDSDCDDIFFCQKAAQQFADEFQIRTVPDAITDSRWLVGEGDFADREAFPLPDILVTELKTRFVDGIELVEWIRAQPQFKSLPVLIYTASMSPKDLVRCVSFGAAFIPKNANRQTLVEHLHDYFAVK